MTNKWPLTLEFALQEKQRAAFAADVNVVISDAKNHTVLQVQSDGPFLLAKVAPGTDKVTATLAGKTLSRQDVEPAGACLIR